MHIVVGHRVADGTLPVQDRIDTIVNWWGNILVCIRVSIDPELSSSVDLLSSDGLKLIIGELMILLIGDVIMLQHKMVEWGMVLLCKREYVIWLPMWLGGGCRRREGMRH